jgi:hypothetical protein
MNKVLIFLSLLSTGLILEGCASNVPKTTDAGVVPNSSIETDSQRTGNSSPTNITTTNKTITWGTSETRPNDPQENSRAEIPAKPDLSGSWVLNKKLSDNPEEKFKETIKQARNTKGGSSSGRGDSGRSGRRGGGMKGGASSGGRSGKRGSQDSSLQNLQALLNASETLVLNHKEPMLLIVTDDGRKQRIFTSNLVDSVSANGGLQKQTTTAYWKQDILVVETTIDTGPKLIHRYKLLNHQHRLLISTAIQLPGASNAILINRVYELADERTEASKYAIIPTDN